MPIIAISQPRLAIIAHMRWAMKPGESFMTVILAPDLASSATAASRTPASAPGAVMTVRRLAVSPVRSTAMVRLGSRPSSIAVVVQSLPMGATRIGLLPSSAPSILAPSAAIRPTSFLLCVSMMTTLDAGTVEVGWSAPGSTLAPLAS